MRSKILKLIAVLAMCFMVVGALVACGEAGPAGPTGPKGDKGDTGATGNGIVSIDLSTDGTKLVIKYTNGTTAEVAIPSASDACDVCENVTIHEFFGEWHGADYDAETDEWTFEKGKYLKVCNDCGLSEIVEDVIHDFTEGTIAPTCETIGFDGKYCEICGYYEAIEGTEVPATGHNFAPSKLVIDEGRNVCTEGYWTLGLCTECDATSPMFVEPAGHTVAEWDYDVAPTATTKGSLIGTCTVCGDDEVKHELPALNDVDYVCEIEAATCIGIGEATYTYTLGEQEFEYVVVLAATGHTVAGVPVADLKTVGGAYVYGQAGIKLLDTTVAPKCGQIFAGFYTCDDCDVNVSIDVYGDHVWGEPEVVDATCTHGTQSIYKCTEKYDDVLCTGTKTVEADDKLPHTIDYKLTYDVENDVFYFGKACLTCDTQTEKNVVTPVYDEAGSVLPQCNKDGYKLYKYTFMDGEVEKTVSCKVAVEKTNVHTLVVDGKVVLPDELDDGTLAYSSAYIGKGLHVLTDDGEEEPDQVTCGNKYEGFFDCVCGEITVKVTIYNPHELEMIEHADNKKPTCVATGTQVWQCTKECCETVPYYYYETLETVEHDFEYALVEVSEGVYKITVDCKTCDTVFDDITDLTEDDFTITTVDSTCAVKGSETITVKKDLNNDGMIDIVTLKNELPLAAHKLTADKLITDWDYETIGGVKYYKFVSEFFKVLDMPVIDCGVKSTFEGFFVCLECATNSKVNLYADHTYEKYEITKKPTCTVDGEKTAFCTKCDAVDTQPIPATGHNNLKAVVDVANDVVNVVCKDCSTAENTVIVATVDLPEYDVNNAEYDWEGYTRVDVEADCFNKGAVTYSATLEIEVAGTVKEFAIEFTVITSETTHAPATGDYITFECIETIDGVEWTAIYTVYECEYCGNFVVVDCVLVALPLAPVDPAA